MTHVDVVLFELPKMFISGIYDRKMTYDTINVQTSECLLIPTRKTAAHKCIPLRCINSRTKEMRNEHDHKILSFEGIAGESCLVTSMTCGIRNLRMVFPPNRCNAMAIIGNCTIKPIQNVITRYYVKHVRAYLSCLRKFTLRCNCVELNKSCEEKGCINRISMNILWWIQLNYHWNVMFFFVDYYYSLLRYLLISQLICKSIVVSFGGKCFGTNHLLIWNICSLKTLI